MTRRRPRQRRLSPATRELGRLVGRHPCDARKCCQGWGIHGDAIARCTDCNRFKTDAAAVAHILACGRCYQQAAAYRKDNEP